MLFSCAAGHSPSHQPFCLDAQREFCFLHVYSDAHPASSFHSLRPWPLNLTPLYPCWINKAQSSLQLSPHLYRLVLVDAKAVHQAKDLFAVLSHTCLALSRQRLLVQNRPLYGNIQSHPLVLLDLGHSQTLRWVQDQHPADQVLTVCEGWKEQSQGMWEGFYSISPLFKKRKLLLVFDHTEHFVCKLSWSKLSHKASSPRQSGPDEVGQK